MKSSTEKHPSLLKKALIVTLAVAVPGGTLLGLAYLFAKKHKAKTAATLSQANAAEPPPRESA